MMRFDGRVAVVTGAGSGLGRSHARLLAARGASVVVNDLVEPSAVVAEIAEAGGSAVGCAADVATGEGAAAVVDAAVASFGRLDVVVNNAGVLRSCELAATTEELWDGVVAVNLRGTFLVTRAAWPALVEGGGGRIVSTTSNSGLLGTAGSSAYAAAKAAIWGLTRTLALEGADVGVAANAVAPIAFTPMSAGSRIAPASWRSGEGDAWAARLDPAAVSPVVAWLAHDGCPLNGEVLSVAGGRVARFFMGLTEGFADDALSIEAVADRVDEVLATDRFEILDSAAAEGRHLHRRLMT